MPVYFRQPTEKGMCLVMEKNYIDVLNEILKDETKIVDLSYTMEENMPVWPTHATYGSDVYESWDYGDAAIHSRITLGEHTGTHIDAPKHFIKGGTPIDELDVKRLMGRGVMIDATNIAPRAVLPLEQIKDFEEKNGEIRKGDIILIRFGWDDKYALQPNGAAFLNDWPGLSKEAAEYFVEKEVSAVGCDALALDAFGCDVNVSHVALLGHGIPILENLTNLSKLPVFSYVIGLPNKFKGGSGSPIRMIAFIA